MWEREEGGESERERPGGGLELDSEYVFILLCKRLSVIVAIVCGFLIVYFFNLVHL